ncbi:MFS transporter [Clostridium subterminale]|uniref:MFS transporter n=1 Tax=Clostridium subterminale TaxID=1550 RepID=A0ABP3W1J0_CLOSU
MLDVLNKKKVIKTNIILYTAGQIVSLFGTYIFNFFMSLYVLQVTGSALSFGLTFGISILPRIIFGPISGVVVDRLDRKKIIVSFDFLCGIIVLLFWGASSLWGLKNIFIYIATFLLSACNTLFNTALAASIPNIVDDDGIVKVNSLRQMIDSAASVCAPFLGGILFSFIDINFFIVINGVSFIFSAITEIFIRFDVNNNSYVDVQETNESEAISKSSHISDFIDGVKYLKSQKWLINLCYFMFFFNSLIIIGLVITLPYITNEILGFSSEQYGILNTMYPLGLVIASLVYSKMAGDKNNNRRITKCIFIMSVSIFIMGLIASQKMFTLSNLGYLSVFGVLYFIIGFAEALVNVPIYILIQKMIPNDKLGRVYSIIETLVLGLAPISSIVGGLLVEQISPWIIQIICGISMVLLTTLLKKVGKVYSA